MSELNKNWTPSFGTVYTWYAMDKNGKIAMIRNNSWGDIPKCILEKPNAEALLTVRNLDGDLRLTRREPADC